MIKYLKIMFTLSIDGGSESTVGTSATAMDIGVNVYCMCNWWFSSGHICGIEIKSIEKCRVIECT